MPGLYFIITILGGIALYILLSNGYHKNFDFLIVALCWRDIAGFSPERVKRKNRAKF